jgi:hypothetical protein
MKKRWIIIPILSICLTVGIPYIPLNNYVPVVQAAKKLSKSQLKSYALSFGNRSVDYIQKLPNTYHGTKVGDKMYYLYRPDNVDKTILVRVDSPDNFTAVYKYNKRKKNLLGKKLYEGRTIFQKQEPTYIYQ